jgi:hypothetical protein
VAEALACCCRSRNASVAAASFIGIAFSLFHRRRPVIGAHGLALRAIYIYHHYALVDSGRLFFDK